MPRPPRKPPRLLYSELTGTVYVITRYTERPHPTKKGRGIVVASVKHDVTADFLDVVRQWQKNRRPKKRANRAVGAVPQWYAPEEDT
jgi:hypothetical protein